LIGRCVFQDADGRINPATICRLSFSPRHQGDFQGIQRMTAGGRFQIRHCAMPGMGLSGAIFSLGLHEALARA
jgi:hypothetical protein